MDACFLLERIPDVTTAINSLPVDYVSACIVELSLRNGMHGKSLNLANPQSFMLDELTQQICNVGGPSIQCIDYQEWRQLCYEHPDTRRLASIMPHNLLTDASGETRSACVHLSNAVVDLSHEEGLLFSIPNNEMLQKYVTWRHHRLGQIIVC